MNHTGNADCVLCVLAVFYIGLACLLPADWPSLLGPLSGAVVQAVDRIPAISQMAALSDIPRVVEGFFGIVHVLTPTLLVVAAVMLLVRYPGFVRARMEAIGKARLLSFLLPVVVPTVAVMSYFAYFELPLGSASTDRISRSVTLYSLISSSRLGLATIGVLYSVTYLMVLGGGMVIASATGLCILDAMRRALGVRK